MATAVLTIDINARLAKLEEGLTKTVSAVGRSSKAIESSLAGLNSAARSFGASLVAALSLAAFTRLIKGSIDAADHLNDLSKSTGVAVEKLGGIGFAASQSGSDLDSAAQAFGKLNLSIAKATAGNEDAARIFRTIGISVAELAASSPDEIFAKIADKFASYDDGANKAALGNAIFGKSYQTIIPLLDEGGEKLKQNIAYYERYGGITKETAERADQFNDTLTKLHLLNGAFGRTLSAAVLPTLEALANHMVTAKEKGAGLSTIAEGLAKIFNITAAAGAYLAGVMVAVGETAGAAAAASVEFVTGNFSIAAGIMSDLRKANAETDRRYTELAKTILAGNTKVETAVAATGKKLTRPAPSLGSGDADDAAKKILEGRLKAFENAIASERDVLKDREHFLQAYYQDDLLGIKEYFDKRQEIILDALARELTARDSQIAELQDSIAKANPKDRADLENKLADIVEKRGKAQNDASIKGINLWLEERKSAKLFRDEVEDISIALAALSGSGVDAGAAAFDKAHEKFRAQAQLQLQSADEMERRLGAIGLRDLELLKKRTVEQLELNEATQKYTLTIDAVGRAEERINISLQSGAITELQALQQISTLRASKLALLTQELDVQQKIAAAMEAGPARDQALANIDAMRVKIEELAATGDLVAKKFNDIGSGAFSTFLQDLTTGKPMDALKSLGNNLFTSINRVVSDNLAQMAFGKGGPLSGFGDIFSKLFGGKGVGEAAGGAAGAAALTGAGATLTASGTILVTAGTLHTAAAAALTGAAAALAAAAVASGASSIAGAAGKIFSAYTGPQFGTYATGTPFVPRDMLAVVHQGERITSAADNRGGMRSASRVVNVTNATINVLPNADYRTARHIMRDIYMQGASVARRGG